MQDIEIIAKQILEAAFKGTNYPERNVRDTNHEPDWRIALRKLLAPNHTQSPTLTSYDSIVPAESIELIVKKPTQLLKELRETQLPPHGIEFQGCKITGQLSLDGEEIKVPLIFRDCIFDNGVVLRDAKARTILFRNCFVPFVAGERAEVDGSFAISGSFVPLGIRLDGARFEGGVLLYGSTVCSPTVWFADSPSFPSPRVPRALLRYLALDALKSAATINLNDEIWPPKAFQNMLVETNHRFYSDSQNRDFIQVVRDAIKNDFSTEKPLLSMLSWLFPGKEMEPAGARKPESEGLVQTFLAIFFMEQTFRTGGSRSVFSTPLPQFIARFDFQRYLNLMSEKSVSLSNIDVRQDLNCGIDFRATNDASEIENDKRPRTKRFCSFGRVSLPGSRIRGDAKFNGAKLFNVWRAAKQDRVITLKLDGASINGSLELNLVETGPQKKTITFDSYGTIRALGCKIGGALVCEGARLHGFHLLTDSNVYDDPRLDSEKKVLCLGQGDLRDHSRWKKGQAISISQCEIDGTFYFRKHRSEEADKKRGEIGVIRGFVSFRDTKCGRLSEDIAYYPSAPGFLVLDGFQYDGFTETHVHVVEKPITQWLLFGRESPRTQFALSILYSLSILALLLIFPKIVWPLLVSTLIFFSLILLGRTFATFPRLSKQHNRENDRLQLLLDQASWLLSTPTAQEEKKTDQMSTGFKGQPFEMLAEALEHLGETKNASHVRVVEETLRVLDKPPSSANPYTEFRRILGLIAHFGYKPTRLLYLLIMYSFISGLLFNSAHHSGMMVASNDELVGGIASSNDISILETCPTSNSAITSLSHQENPECLKAPYPKFHVASYTIDVAIPYIDLGQKKYWAPYVAEDKKVEYSASAAKDSNSLPHILNAALSLATKALFFGSIDRNFLEAWIRIMTFLGWVLSSAVVAGLAGIMKSRD